MKLPLCFYFLCKYLIFIFQLGLLRLSIKKWAKKLAFCRDHKNMINSFKNKREVITLPIDMPKHLITSQNKNYSNVIGWRRMILVFLQQFGIYMMHKLPINSMNLNNYKKILKEI